MICFIIKFTFINTPINACINNNQPFVGCYNTSFNCILKQMHTYCGIRMHIIIYHILCLLLLFFSFFFSSSTPTKFLLLKRYSSTYLHHFYTPLVFFSSVVLRYDERKTQYVCSPFIHSEIYSFNTFRTYFL